MVFCIHSCDVTLFEKRAGGEGAQAQNYTMHKKGCTDTPQNPVEKNLVSRNSFSTALLNLPASDLSGMLSVLFRQPWV